MFKTLRDDKTVTKRGDYAHADNTWSSASSLKMGDWVPFKDLREGYNFNEGKNNYNTMGKTWSFKKRYNT